MLAFQRWLFWTLFHVSNVNRVTICPNMGVWCISFMKLCIHFIDEVYSIGKLQPRIHLPLLKNHSLSSFPSFGIPQSIYQMRPTQKACIKDRCMKWDLEPLWLSKGPQWLSMLVRLNRRDIFFHLSLIYLLSVGNLRSSPANFMGFFAHFLLIPFLTRRRKVPFKPFLLTYYN